MFVSVTSRKREIWTMEGQAGARKKWGVPAGEARHV